MIALVTDTHAGKKNFCPKMSRYFLRFHNEIFFPALEEAGIKTVIHLGDVFDRREYIDFRNLFEWRKQYFDEFVRRGIDLHIICGNHDTYFRNTNEVNALDQLLAPYPFHVYLEPSEVEIDGHTFLFLPWLPHNDDRVNEMAEKFLKKTKARFVFGHLEIVGFRRNSGNVNDKGFSPEKFKRFEKVFSGHFHYRSTGGNVWYLGSPYPMNWGDYGDERGFHFFDPGSGDVEFLPNPFEFFHKIQYHDDRVPEIDAEKIKDAYVKVVIEKREKTALFERFMNMLNEAEPEHVALVESFLDDVDADQIEMGEEPVDAKDTLSIICDFIEDAEVIAEKKKREGLKDLFRGLYLRANDMGADG